MSNIAKQSAVLITWLHLFKKGARPEPVGPRRRSGYRSLGSKDGRRFCTRYDPQKSDYKPTNLLARARSSSASDKSKSAHRPKHCTKPPISGGMENPVA